MFVIEQVRHFYKEKLAVQVASWQVSQGEQWLLRGGSGSGKTTLLHILGGLLRASEGIIRIGDTNISTLNGAKLDAFRGKNIGIVFQQSYLIHSLTVLENMLLAQYMAGFKQDKTLCINLLEKLNIAYLIQQKPYELSQGEAQRIAIARALLNRPTLLLADEPTSSLDDENAFQVAELLKSQASDTQATLVISTHDSRLVPYFEKVFQLAKS